MARISNKNQTAADWAGMSPAAAAYREADRMAELKKLEMREKAAYYFEMSPVVILPGPRWGARGDRIGYGPGEPVACACADCMKVFQGPEMPKGNYGPGSEITAECPDCGAMLQCSPDRMRADWLERSDGKGVQIDIPERRVLEAGFDGPERRITDTVYTRGITVQPGRPDTMEQACFADRIEYSPGRIVSYKLDDKGQVAEPVLAGREGGPGRSVYHNAMSMNGARTAADRQPPGRQRHAGVRELELGPSLGHKRDWASEEYMEPGAGRSAYPVSALDDNFNSARYAAIADAYGLPAPSSERVYGRAPRMDGTPEYISKNQMAVISGLAFQYPAVFDREIDRINENLKYAKEPVPDADARRMRLEAVGHAAMCVYDMDAKLSAELRLCRTAKDVDDCLRAVTFGEKNGRASGHIKVDVSDAEGYAGKYLKKQFNIDPYRAAANVYTCRKLGFTDINSVREIFERGKAAYPSGVVPPVETREAMSFCKLYAKTHSPTETIRQLYPIENVEHSRQFYKDAVAMYMELKPARLVRTSAEKDRSDYLDMINQGKTFFAGGRTVEDFAGSQAFRQAFGDKTRQVAEACWAEYRKDPELKPNPYLPCRDGKPLFENRTVAQIHDELSDIANRDGGSHENVVYDYSEQAKRKINRQYDGWDVHLVKDSIELWTAGSTTQTCVYGSYRRSVANGSTRIVLATNPEGRIDAVIELDKGMNTMNQCKGFRNTALYGEPMRVVQQWMQDTGVQLTSTGKQDVAHFGEEGYYFYGNMNHHHGGPRPEERRAAAREAHYMTADAFLAEHAKAQADPKAGRGAAEAIAQAAARAEAVQHRFDLTAPAYGV